MADAIPATKTHDLRLWKERWQQAAPVLEKLRNDELRRLTPKRRLETLDGLLSFGNQFRRPKSVAAWAEFQRQVVERFG